ncbi:MAG: cytochrome c oxidase assembly protein [Rhodobacteraceae bacterium]|nr:cytochrome c oxidase assembly protein [Paracoccaceae bacterium]
MSKNSNRKTVIGAISIVVFMGTLSFAAVPFYDWFCRVTGFGGTTQLAQSDNPEILDKTIIIKFDANTERGMPWDFKPVEHELELKIGETGLAFYQAYNPTSKPVAGTASFNVFPYSAGGYFTKIACFCFEEQVLQPGEKIDMPVSFYIDPEIVKDKEAKFAKSITLSYTFHRTELPQDQASLFQLSDK